MISEDTKPDTGEVERVAKAIQGACSDHALPYNEHEEYWPYLARAAIAALNEGRGEKEVVERLIKWSERERAQFGPTNNALVMADAVVEIRALAAEVAELREALKPFAEFASNVDESGWTSDIHREQISTWFGPSDFRRALLSSTKGEGA